MPSLSLASKGTPNCQGSGNLGSFHYTASPHWPLDGSIPSPRGTPGPILRVGVLGEGRSRGMVREVDEVRCGEAGSGSKLGIEEKVNRAKEEARRGCELDGVESRVW